MRGGSDMLKEVLRRVGDRNSCYYPDPVQKIEYV